MKVEKILLNGLVIWKCVQGPRDWVGTAVTILLIPKQGQTIFLFTHAGWKESVEFMHPCSTKWGTFLLNERYWIETGTERPSPYDLVFRAGDQADYCLG